MFWGGEAALGPAVRPVVAGGLGGCMLKMNCRPSLNYMSSASLLPLRSVSTVAFRFHSKFQFRQLSSESTVFTSSVVLRWFLVMLILHPFTSSIGDAIRIPLEIDDVCLVLLQP